MIADGAEMPGWVSTESDLAARRRPTSLIRDPDELLRRGIEALEYGHTEDAARFLNQAVIGAPESVDALLALGIAYTSLLKVPEAFEALEKAISLAPENFYAHFRLAQLYLRVGVPSKGREELECAMELSTSPEQRRMVREMLAIDAKRGAKRVWRPDFSRLWRQRKLQ
jgi:Tfp pilus assembly protein PilF